MKNLHNKLQIYIFKSKETQAFFYMCNKEYTFKIRNNNNKKKSCKHSNLEYKELRSEYIF